VRRKSTISSLEVDPESIIQNAEGDGSGSQGIFEDHKRDLEFKNLIITGPPGSGKSAMGDVIAETFVQDINNKANFLRCDGKRASQRSYTDDLGKKIRRFQKLNSSLEPGKIDDIPKKAILIDNFDSFTPKTQQVIRQDLEECNWYASYILVCDDPMKCVEPLRAQCTIVKMDSLTEEEIMLRVLQVCNSERIGWERDGLEMMLECVGVNLDMAFETVRILFQKYMFISKINVEKIFDTPEKSKSIVDPIRVLNPMPRCEICTLPLPCKCPHNSMARLVDTAARRRYDLPMNPEKEVCPHFEATGCCETFNVLGHCNYHHPLDIHVVGRHATRCPVCTLPIPCEHTHGVTQPGYMGMHPKRRVQLPVEISQKIEFH